MCTLRSATNDDDVDLVGREHERDRLGWLLDRACAGHGSLVLIAGQAGIGKTTLVEHTARQAAKRGMLVLSGGCYDLTITPPYAPWTEMLRTYPDGKRDLPPVPQELRSAERPEDVGSLERYFQIIAGFMADVAAAQPLVLVLEDLHWSDPSSLELLRYLGRQLSRQRIVLLVSYRDDELTRTHPLFTTMPLLVREARAERIDLLPFDAGTIRSLIVSRYTLSRTDTDRLATHLLQHTEGNPLFLVELLRSMELGRLLVRGDTSWLLGKLDEVAPPPLIVQIIERQLSLLDGHTRAVLEVAAILGDEIATDRWQQLVGLNDEGLATVIQQALDTRLIEQRGNHRPRFRHALIRDVLYHETSFQPRRIVHRQAAEMLMVAESVDPDIVADHFRRAGDSRAVDWLVMAGQRAAMSWAHQAAVDRFEEALALLASDRSRLRDRGWLNLMIAINIREIDPDRALGAIDEARRIAKETDDRTLDAHALWGLGQVRFFTGKNGLDEMVDGLAAMRQLSPAELETRPSQLRLLDPETLGSSVALGQTTLGRYPEALSIAEQYLARDPPQTVSLWNERAHAEAARAHALSAFGRPDEAAEAFQSARDAYRSGTNLWFAALNSTPELLYIALRYRADDLTYRRRVAEETEKLWAQASDVRPGFPARYGLLPILVVEGQWSEARELAGPFSSQEMLPFHFALIALGIISRHQGDAALAWQQVETGMPDGPETEPGTRDLLFTREIHQLQYLAADLALDSADLSLASHWITACERWLAWSGSALGQPDVQLLWARHAQISGDDRVARRHVDQALRLATNPRQPLVLAAGQRALATLEIRDARYDAAREALTTALQLATSCTAPYDQALAHLALVEVEAATNRIDAAWTHLDQLRAICTPLGTAPLLLRATELSARLSVRRGKAIHPARLTPREVDVLRLIAKGLSDADVADALFISPRTVNTHLTSIYNKLGVTSRTAATRFAVEHGLADPITDESALDAEST